MTEGAPRNLDVPPEPVRGPRGGGRVALLTLGALVVAVGGAISLAQLQPSPPDPARISFAVPTLAPSPIAAAPGLPAGTGEPAPDPAAVLAATTTRMTRPDLEAAVRDGTLEGRLVFVDGTITHDAAHCPGLTESFGGCVDLAIPGLALPVRQADTAIPWRADPPAGAWLVTVARDGGLVYLGALVPRFADGRPVTLVPGGADPARAGTLFEVEGYLVLHPVHTCFRPGVPATPCPPPSPFLALDEPTPEGVLVSDAGLEVSLARTVAEVDEAAVVTPGTFLVQPDRREGRAPVVVARFDPSRAVRVLVP